MPSAQKTTDDVRSFAADLRELRYAAGNPTLRALTARTFVSKSVLSSAFAGRLLPTANTTERLVSALGGDPEQWAHRLADLREQQRQRLRDSDVDVDVPTLAAARRPRRRTTASAVASAALTVAVALAIAVATGAFGHVVNAPTAADEGSRSARAAAAFLPVVPDADPLRTSCRDDDEVRRSEPRLDGALVLAVHYSPRCGAAWAEVTRRDAGAAGQALTIEVYRDGDRYGARGKPRTSAEAPTVRTGLLLGVTSSTVICALASLDVAGGSEELSPPLCG